MGSLTPARRPPPSATDLLGRMVAIDTTSARSNLPLVELIADVLERPGVRVDRVASADGTKACLVVQVGPDTDPAGREGLILSGHLDCVPATEDGWRTDPFTLTATADGLAARGACDMKGFVALAVERAARVDPTHLRAPLVLVLTYDEEVGSLGAQRLAELWPGERPLPRAAVIGEPTALRVIRMHKGHLRLRVTTTGVPAHSGYPHRGRNAIEPAARAVLGLAELGRALAAERPEHAARFPEVPFVALNVGRIEGGAAVNVVPDRCTIELGVRLLPGLESAEVVERVRDALARAVPGGEAALEIVNDSPPLLTAREAPVHRDLCAVAGGEQETGVSYASDAGTLARMGVDCVLYGPGSIEVAHKPNEFVPPEELARAGAVLDALVARRCGGGGTDPR